jgi:hypothetical protein
MTYEPDKANPDKPKKPEPRRPGGKTKRGSSAEGLREAREEVAEGGGMSRVRIYDLTRELKPETKKALKIARRMGITDALNVADPRRRKPPTKKPKK